MGVVATVAVVWFGQPTPSGQENPFTGTSFRLEAGDVRVSSRGFEAGARTHWHTHSEQLLYVKEGGLRYQVEGQPVMPTSACTRPRTCRAGSGTGTARWPTRR